MANGRIYAFEIDCNSLEKILESSKAFVAPTRNKVLKYICFLKAIIACFDYRSFSRSRGLHLNKPSLLSISLSVKLLSPPVTSDILRDLSEASRSSASNIYSMSRMSWDRSHPDFTLILSHSMKILSRMFAYWSDLILS